VTAAARANPALAKGVNVWGGKVVHPGVAESIGEAATPLAAVLG
jgi:alanine dehydrogenase